MLIPLDPDENADSLVQFIVDIAVVLAGAMVVSGGMYLLCQWFD